MSGGGGGGIDVPPIRTRVTVSCERLVVETTLVKPNEELLGRLNVGDLLLIQPDVEGIGATYGDEVVGRIETPDNSKLLECIREGTIYVAEIISIEGTVCKVKIRAHLL